MKFSHNDTRPYSLNSHERKRSYKPPQLEVFGRVVDITRSASCEEQSDSNSIAVCAPGNMAMQTTGGSDRRLKENIIEVGKHPLGIGLYLFDYKPEFRNEWGHGRQFGVMAQEVETLVPEAITNHSNGYKMVNYTMLGITRFAH